METLPPLLHKHANDLKKKYEEEPVSYENFINYDTAEDLAHKTLLKDQLLNWYKIYTYLSNKIKDNKNINQQDIIIINKLKDIAEEIDLIEIKIKSMNNNLF
jgi:hypothetical protein